MSGEASTAWKGLDEELARVHSRGLGGRLHRGHAADRARTLVRALAEGQPVAQAAEQAGLGALGGALETAAPPDLPAALRGLLQVDLQAAAHARVLQAAGTYPLVLSVAILAVALVVEPLALPALARLPEAGAGPSPWFSRGAVLVATTLLALQAALVLGRVPRGPAGPGWRRIESWAFLARLDHLLRAGAALPAALRGAAQLQPSPAQALALAQALEAGDDPAPEGPLLRPHEARVLLGSARHGAAAAAVEALCASSALALKGDLPWVAGRVHLAALFVAGVALACVGGSLFLAYGRALGG